MNIAQSVMCYPSMHSSRQALQTGGKLFQIRFRYDYNILKIMVALGINACLEGEALKLW